MKIGIISCDGWLRQWDNYGTLFQNFALQKYLQKQGHEPFWILTKPEGRSLKQLIHNAVVRPCDFFSSVKKFVFAQILRSGKSRLYDFSPHEVATINQFNERNPRKFAPFFEKYVPHTSSRFSGTELLQAPPSADAYIVGSDNIWGGVSIAGFLGFGEATTKKVAYAVSAPWGKLNRRWIFDAKRKIGVFNGVSVRETEGIEICRKAGREDVVCVCDPTLLLDRRDYMDIVAREGADTAFERKTILAYLINTRSFSALPLKELLVFSEEVKAEVKIVPLQGSELIVPEEFIFAPSPAEWLNAYDKSEFVITNSFHGTVFAIIMRKPFVVILQKGEMSVANCRFLSTLLRLGLEDRIWSGEGKISEVAFRKIDWGEVEEKLNDFRHHSEAFLEKALS